MQDVPHTHTWLTLSLDERKKEGKIVFVSKVELCVCVTDPQTEQDKSSLKPHDITETPQSFAEKTQLFFFKESKLKSAT